MTPTATPVVTPTPTATPVRNTSVGAQPVRGTVLVKLPGTTRFVPLDPSVIRNGSEVDTRKGRVEITTSSNEKATFYDGIFKVSQSGGLTTLTLTEKLAPCPRAKQASAAAKKPKTRKLWGDGKGKFRTKGAYSAATIRGTRWLVQDGCRYTRTTVARGQRQRPRRRAQEDVRGPQGQVLHGQTAPVTQTSVGCGKRPTAVMVGPVRMRRLFAVPLAVLAILLAAGPAWRRHVDGHRRVQRRLDARAATPRRTPA